MVVESLTKESSIKTFVVGVYESIPRPVELASSPPTVPSNTEMFSSFVSMVVESSSSSMHCSKSAVNDVVFSQLELDTVLDAADKDGIV